MSRLPQTPVPAPSGTLAELASWAMARMRELFFAVNQAQEMAFCVSFSDETTAITTGTGKASFHYPWAMRLTRFRLDLGVAQDSGSLLTVDINASGTSVLGTKLTIDNDAETSLVAATPYTFASTDTLVSEGQRGSIDVDQVGDGTAKGGKVWIYGVAP